MAANLEQIFQDFILNKIREIEDQHKDKDAVTERGGAEVAGAQKASSERDKQEDVSGSQKKHKKHKKHKSKKKKRKREKESSSESGAESEGGSKHQHSRRTPADVIKESGEDNEGKSRSKQHSSGKRKKKKKRRRKEEEMSSSDSDSELESKQKHGKCGHSSLSRRREDLPDIIPKQDSKGGEDGERGGRRKCRSHSRSPSHSHSRSRSHSYSNSRSSSVRRMSRPRSRHRLLTSRTHSQSRSRRRWTRSRSCSGQRSTKTSSTSDKLNKDNASIPSNQDQLFSLAPPLLPPSHSSATPAAFVGGWKPLPFLEQTSSSSEKKRTSHESTQCIPDLSADLQPPLVFPKAEGLIEANAERQRADHNGKTAEGHKNKATENGGSAASKASLIQSTSVDPDQTTETSLPQYKTSGDPQTTSATTAKSPTKKQKTPSKSPQKKREAKTSKRKKKSKSPHASHKRRSRSRSPSRKKRSRSRSVGRRSRRSCSRSRSASRGRWRTKYSQRDRWKREPSHSPVLILRKNRSPSRKQRSPSESPQRISDLDKGQLLEIAKANAAAMCAKAGMPIPASLRSTMLPLALPTLAMNAAMASMTAATMTAALSSMGALTALPPLPTITNKPPPVPAQPNMAALEEAKKKVAKQANSISIKEFTDKCKMIVDSKGELPVAKPHVSDEEDDGKPFGGSSLREQKAISFSINNVSVRPTVRSDAGMAKEFPVSSGSQHRKKEGEPSGAYGEWVPIDKMGDKAKYAAAASSKAPIVPIAMTTPSAPELPAVVPATDSVFPDPPQQPVDISQAVTERIKAQRRLAENPYDVSAICMLSRAQEQVDAWAQSNTIPGLFTGSTGAQVLSSEELSTSGPQAWLKKDQFLRAAPVSGGVGEFLMRKMGWKTGEGLGRNREGTVEPIIIDFKVDRKGLVAEGEKAQKQTGGLVVTKDLMGKHPVSALIELCNKQRIMQPDFVMVHHSGPDHRKNFLFKVTVNGMDYQPQTASPNKKHAKAMAATVALQALGEVPVDGPGLYTGPVFTAASTGPLFST